MLDFDIFCLKLRRWELHRELEESGIYIAGAILAGIYDIKIHLPLPLS